MSKYLLLISLILILFNCNAQKDKIERRESDQIIITFDDSDSDKIVIKNGEKKYKRSFPKNNLKLTLFGPAYGNTQFLYERYITDFFTIQAGAGLSSRDFFGDLYTAWSFNRNRTYYSENWNDIDDYDTYDDYFRDKNRKTSIGLFVSVSPRFFPWGDEFDGFYLAPIIEYGIRNFKTDGFNSDGTLANNNIKEKSSVLHAFFGFGKQWNTEPITIDFSINSGINYSTHTRLDKGIANYSSSNPTYLNKVIKFKVLRPYFKLSLDIGYTFRLKKSSDKKINSNKKE